MAAERHRYLPCSGGNSTGVNVDAQHSENFNPEYRILLFILCCVTCLINRLIFRDMGISFCSLFAYYPSSSG